MVNESEFDNNDSQWTAFRKNGDTYLKELEITIQKATPARSGRTDSVIAANTKNRFPRHWKLQRKASGLTATPENQGD